MGRNTYFIATVLSTLRKYILSYAEVSYSHVLIIYADQPVYDQPLIQKLIHTRIDDLVGKITRNFLAVWQKHHPQEVIGINLLYPDYRKMQIDMSM